MRQRHDEVKNGGVRSDVKTTNRGGSRAGQLDTSCGALSSCRHMSWDTMYTIESSGASVVETQLTVCGNSYRAIYNNVCSVHNYPEVGKPIAIDEVQEIEKDKDN